MSDTKKKPAKPREPEEVWYDVHKHPEGVPGGMGRSPEHHLRNRGWNGHEINGAGSKTMQYRNQKHPDFVISYGGGTAQKPDHNFRVLYMGGNANIPKVTRAYSVAEAMNTAEELHQLHMSGYVVQPMLHGAATNLRSGPLGYGYGAETSRGLVCPECHGDDLYSRDFRVRHDEPDWGCNDCGEKFHSPVGRDVVSDSGWERAGDAFSHTAAYRTQTPSLAQQPNIAQDKTFVAPPPPDKVPEMGTNDYAHPIGPPETEFPSRPDREHDWPKKQKPQLKEIPDPAQPKPATPYKTSAVLRLARQATWEEL